MTARAVALLVLLPALLMLTGCAALHPDHVAVALGCDEAETSGDRRTRTFTKRGSVTATWDLH